MVETWTKEQFWAELDAMGEDTVRLRVRTVFWGPASEKVPLAEEWLSRKERDRNRVVSSSCSKRPEVLNRRGSFSRVVVNVYYTGERRRC